jgi:phospholipid/cholesterol/gamma-HCH transport system substrate-binding protein
VRRQPNFNDGVDEPLGKGTMRTGTSYAASDLQLGGFGGYAGSREESELLANLLAPGLGTSASDVPDLGGLLVGPMVRGATVSLGDPGGGVSP